MIKFFRQIRKKLLSENKFSKYLLYAIGEIVLVVIGILIALSINNWNDLRKDKFKEHVILKQLKEEYAANLEQLDGKIQLRKKIIQSGLISLSYMDAPKTVQWDSTIFHLSNTIFDPTFDPIQNDLIISGNIRLIENERLKRLLSNWTSDVKAVQELELINQNHVHEVMLPLFNDIGISRDVLSKLWKNMGDSFWLLNQSTDSSNLVIKHANDKTTPQQILSNKKLEGVIANAISYNNICNLESMALRKRIVEILDLIKIQLDEQ